MKTGRLYSTLAKTDCEKDMRKGCGNYKPVSLKSVSGKIMERVTLGAKEKHVKHKAISSFLQLINYKLTSHVHLILTFYFQPLLN